MKNVLVVAVGQSNLQGAGRNDNGGPIVRYRSQFTGEQDPFPGCNNLNQGCSLFPMLIDLGVLRGVKYTVLNYAIGGASIFQYTGRLGATVSGGAASLPAQQGFMSPVTLTGGTTVQNEGGPNFDPFNLLGRTRTAIQSGGYVGKFDGIVGIWSNGESDAGVGQNDYRLGLRSVSNYLLNSGCDAVLLGLSSKPFATAAAGYVNLETARAQAVAELRSEGLPVFDGANCWTRWGEYPPLFPEPGVGSYVHLSYRGQIIHATLWDRALQNAGF